MDSQTVYNPERVSKLQKISTRFHSHAAVGDRIVMGIEDDPAMPPKYRGTGGRPEGTIVKIKNEGMSNASLRVRMDDQRMCDLHPYTLDAEKVWEFTESSWPSVLARANPETAYRGSAASDASGEIASLRQQLDEMRSNLQRERTEDGEFRNALIESMAQITGEVASTNKDAKFSRVFQQEFRGAKPVRAQDGMFDSDIEDDY